MTQRRIYQDVFPYFVTVKTIRNIPLFLDERLAMKLRHVMVSACAITGFSIFAYAILPDHLHLLVQKSERGFRNPRSDGKKTISDLVHSVKRNFSRDLHSGRMWQPRFYARIVWGPRYYHNILQYIIFNHQKHLAPKKFEKPPYVFVGERIPD